KGANPDDGRQVRIRLTVEGRRLAEQAVQWPDIIAPTLGVLSREEKVTLLRILLKMIRSFQDKGEISPARMCLSCQYFQPHRYPGTARPHYCAFVQAPFGEGDLRVACPDFKEAPLERREEVWSQLGWPP
ncbi:MAG: MarR family winged helix-turn-helix transcriptional regulator, partial [Bacillota bacterium]|nr:MarR family winged helix-turn-helix transcriptional regulator [Bacillota bacterium]